MKIEKIKKLSNGKYKIIFDNKIDISVYEDIIINYNLLTNKTIDNNTLELINKDNNYYTSYYLALKYINIRLRSIKEITDYLLRKGIDNKTIDTTINKLKEQGYLSDDNFIKAFINDKLIMTNWGPFKIKIELEKLGVAESKIEEEINNISLELLEQKIIKIIDKLYKNNKNLSNNMLKRRIMTYLISLGYNDNMINNYLENIKVDNKKLIQKEYNKLYNKYKNKYDEQQLQYIIKQKLYQKGFDYNDLE
jgi:regulatory protein